MISLKCWNQVIYLFIYFSEVGHNHLTQHIPHYYSGSYSSETERERQRERERET
jgi:hypothetical protein